MRNPTATASVNHEFLDFIDSIDGIEDEFEDLDECYLGADMYVLDGIDQEFDPEDEQEAILNIF